LTTIDLKRGTILRLRDRACRTVTARVGSLWITEQASPRDVLLRTGQSFTLTRSGVALVEAISDASVFLA